jgi:hypothetical protein
MILHVMMVLVSIGGYSRKARELTAVTAPAGQPYPSRHRVR